jgi:hypothetical protein
MFEENSPQNCDEDEENDNEVYFSTVKKPMSLQPLINGYFGLCGLLVNNFLQQLAAIMEFNSEETGKNQ